MPPRIHFERFNPGLEEQKAAKWPPFEPARFVRRQDYLATGLLPPLCLVCWLRRSPLGVHIRGWLIYEGTGLDEERCLCKFGALIWRRTAAPC